ncbi:MAG: hypothetical protein MZV49_14840 [Rhodopseudomonas palustris]|nr:hypothetical protein [Rhodopseudomonas palustris]
MQQQQAGIAGDRHPHLIGHRQPAAFLEALLLEEHPHVLFKDSLQRLRQMPADLDVLVQNLPPGEGNGARWSFRRRQKSSMRTESQNQAAAWPSKPALDGKAETLQVGNDRDDKTEERRAEDERGRRGHQDKCGEAKEHRTLERVADQTLLTELFLLIGRSLRRRRGKFAPGLVAGIATDRENRAN